MTPLLYLNCLVIAILGLIISVLLQLKSQRDKALASNLILPTFANYVKTEWITIALAVVVIIVGLFFIPIVVGWKPQYLPFVRPAFLPIGYMGTDILLKLFGVVNSRLNAAISAKSLQADTANGTLGTPTPATKP